MPIASRGLGDFCTFGTRSRFGAKVRSPQLLNLPQLANIGALRFGARGVQKSVPAILSSPSNVVLGNSFLANQWFALPQTIGLDQADRKPNPASRLRLCWTIGYT